MGAHVVSEPLREAEPEAWVGVPGRLALWSVQACERASVSLLLWPKAAIPGENIETKAGGSKAPISAAPYRCGSWRCRRCGWGVARDDYRRIEAAATSRPRWLYMVLTFRRTHERGAWGQYLDAGRLWNDGLAKRLRTRFGRLTYLQTWERHNDPDGWPHVNVLLDSPRLMQAVDAAGIEREWCSQGAHGRGRWASRPKLRRELLGLAEASGFGPVGWVELIEGAGAMAAYLTKCAHELSCSMHKMGDQRPLGAPAHFRRIRASRGLLPPRTKVVCDRSGAEPRLIERPLTAETRYTGILISKPLSAFEDRDPTWTDVADGFEAEARRAAAWWKRKGAGRAPTYET